MATGYSVGTRFTAKDGMSAPLKNMNNNFTRLSKGVQRNSKLMNRSFNNTASVFKGVLGAQIFTRGVAAIRDQFSKLLGSTQAVEDATATFTPILRGSAKAEELVDKLNKTAASTPFQFAAIASTAKQLLPVMDEDIEETVRTFRMLGDTAGGNAQTLQSVTRGFTKALLKGKVDMESLNMISEAGVPIQKHLATEMGVTTTEIYELSRQGKITTQHLKDTFKTMTSEGGQYHNAMQIASKTLSGMQSTLADNITLLRAKIGKALLPTIKEYTGQAIKLASAAADWADRNQEIIKSKLEAFIQGVAAGFKVLVSFLKFFWEYKSVIMLIVGAFIAYKTIMSTIVVISKTWAVVQGILNIALNANPVGLIATAIGLAVVGIIALVKNWDKFKSSIVGGKILSGIKKVGAFIISLLITPLHTLLNIIAKIPGLGFIAKGINSVMDKMQATFNDTTIKAEQKITTPNTIAADQQSEKWKNKIDVNFNNVPDNVGIQTTPAMAPQSNIAVRRAK